MANGNGFKLSWYPVIIALGFLFTGIVTFTTIKMTAKATEKKVEIMEPKVIDHAERIGKIETAHKYIGENLKDMKKEQSEHRKLLVEINNKL